MKLHYAIEIFTGTAITDSAYGIVDGVFRFVTDRPQYDGDTVTPNYGSAEIDVDGNDISGQAVSDVFYEGFLLKDWFTSNPNRKMDITSGGGYSTDYSFAFKIRNDLKFWNFLKLNSIQLTGRRVTMWAAIDDIFYQVGRGRIVNNPYTETEYEFQINDDATLIHKNFPPKMTTTANTDDPTQSDQGDPIPVVLGNVAFSKLLKLDTKTKFENLSFVQVAGARSYSNDGVNFVVTLNTLLQGFVTNDPRLVGKYIRVIAGLDANRDVVYRIKSVAVGNSLGYDTTAVSLDAPLVTGSGSDVVTITAATFASAYAMTYNGAGPGYAGWHSNGNTWWFQISSYAMQGYVSNDTVIPDKLYSYNSGKKSYDDISGLVRLSENPANTINLVANSSDKDGRSKIFERLDVTRFLKSYGMKNSIGVVQEIYSSAADIALVTDGKRSTDKEFSVNICNTSASFFARYRQPTYNPSTLNPLVNNEYDDVYLCVDFSFRAPNFIDQKTFVFAFRYIIEDITANTRTSAWNTPMNLALISSDEFIPANFIPNELDSDSNGFDNKCLLDKAANTDGHTYKRVFKIQDLSPSIFASPFIDSIEFEILIINTTNGVSTSVTVDVKEIAIVGSRSIDTISGDIYTKTVGEKVEDDDTPSSSVFGAFRKILEDYDKIPVPLIDYGDLAISRIDWQTSRTIDEQKNSVEYLNELANHSFVCMFTGRTGKRVLRAFNPTANAPIATHGPTKIIRDSIKGFERSDIAQLFNSFYLQYNWDQGSQKYLRSMSISNIGINPDTLLPYVFPAKATLDAFGDPLWWSYFGGLQGDENDPGAYYQPAKDVWNICQNSYIQNNVTRQAQNDVAELPWFADSIIFDDNDPSGSGIYSAAFKYLEYLAQWATLQKEMISYSIPLNALNVMRELFDQVTVNDAIFTNGQDRVGWITSIEVDPSADQIHLQVTLQPAEIQEYPLVWQDTVDSGQEYQDTVDTGDEYQDVLT